MGVEPIYAGRKPADLSRSPTEHMVDRVGFEPTMPEGGRFTVCWHKPLAHLSKVTSYYTKFLKNEFFTKKLLC